MPQKRIPAMRYHYIPKTTLQLAQYYQAMGREQEAHELFHKLRKQYPSAIGHDGKLLVDQL